jgi:hypothetical protein
MPISCKNNPARQFGFPRFKPRSVIVELDDDSRWQIFPGDLDLTLDWKPETDLSVIPIDDEVSSYTLIGVGGTCA